MKQFLAIAARLRKAAIPQEIFKVIPGWVLQHTECTMQNVIRFVLDDHLLVKEVYINDGAGLPSEHIGDTHCAAIACGCIQVSLNRLTREPKCPCQFLHGCAGVAHSPHFMDMLSDTYVIPLRGVQGTRKLMNVAKLLKQKKVNFFEAVYLLQPEKSSVAERRIMKLVLQTPLSVPELVRCFENDVRDVSSADKVISAIYTEESDNQARLNNASSLSDHRHDVLKATANLYLTRQVILEHA